MTVSDMIEKLQAMPGHWPVHIAVTTDGSGGCADTEYQYILDVERGNFPTHGGMAVNAVLANAVAAQATPQPSQQARQPMADRMWCLSCGEGTTTFCRGNGVDCPLGKPKPGASPKPMTDGGAA
jgi:hypothetical protein